MESAGHQFAVIIGPFLRWHGELFYKFGHGDVPLFSGHVHSMLTLQSSEFWFQRVLTTALCKHASIFLAQSYPTQRASLFSAHPKRRFRMATHTLNRKQKYYEIQDVNRYAAFISVYVWPFLSQKIRKKYNIKNEEK